MRALNFLLVLFLAVALVAGCAKKKEEAAKPEQAATTEVAQLNKCVVCGMQIAAEADTITAEYEGKVYHFCSVQDKEQFLAAPEKYVQKDTTKAETQ